MLVQHEPPFINPSFLLTWLVGRDRKVASLFEQTVEEKVQERVGSLNVALEGFQALSGRDQRHQFLALCVCL